MLPQTAEHQTQLLLVLATFTTLFLTAARIIDPYTLALISATVLLAALATIGWWIVGQLLDLTISRAWYGVLGTVLAGVTVIP